MPKFGAQSEHNLVIPNMLTSEVLGSSLPAVNTIYRYMCTENNDPSTIKGENKQILSNAYK